MNTHQLIITENLHEGYVRDEDGLWISDRLSDEEIQKYRYMAKKIIDVEKENRLYHSFFAEAGVSNRVEPGVARIASELGWCEGGNAERLYDELTLREIIWMLSDIQSEFWKFDEDLNGLTFSELYDKYKQSLLIQKMRMDRRINTREYVKNNAYSIIRIDNFKQLQMFDKYFDCGHWEAAVSEDYYDFLSNNGQNSVFVCLNKRFRDIEPTYDKEPIVWSKDVNYADIDMEDEAYRLVNYDDYGLSMLLVVSDLNGEMIRCEGRYADYFDSENWLTYLDVEELSLILGRNFYDTFI